MASPSQRMGFGGGRGRGPGMGPGDFRKPKNVKGTGLRLLKYFGRNKLTLFWVLILMVVASLTGVGASYLLKPLVDDCIIPNIGAVNKDWSGLINTLLLLSGVYLVSLLAGYAQSVLMMRLSSKTINIIRRDVFDKLQDMPLSFFDGTENGEVMSRFTNDADTVQMALEQTVTSFLSSIITLAAVISIMLSLSASLFLITVVFLVLAVFISKHLGSKSRVLFKKQQRALGTVNGFIEEMIEGIKAVKAFTYEERAKAKFRVLNEDYREAATAANFIGTSMMPIMGQLLGICYAVTTVVGAMLVLQGNLSGTAAFTVGSLGVFLTYTKQLRGPINQVSNQVVTLMSALAGAERIFNIMDGVPESDEGTITLESNISDGNEQFFWNTQDGSVPLHGHIRVEDISFAYEPGKPVLRSVSLEALPGQRIALVGSTGAGKTTITNLINRFYDVQEGRITYDGIDIRDIAKSSLRHSMAVVLQDTHLFTGTVMDNIRYGCLEASDEDCIEAAKTANAYDYIMTLPQGFATRITGDGGSLSQGQRQLLNIARAVVAKRPVLILDEATSSIDTRTEQMIETGMRQLMQGKTVFIIAHRLSTVRGADKIAVIESGQIVEFGSHRELLAKQGKYYEFYSGQAMLE